MPELLTALDAFLQEHRRFGELDGGLDGERVWGWRVTVGLASRIRSNRPGTNCELARSGKMEV